MGVKTPTTQERIARVGQRRQVVIPRDILKTLKLQAGDFVAFAEQKNGVLIKPRRTVNPDDTLTPGEAKMVRRGEAQLKRGESKPWRAVKNALSRFRKYPEREVLEISAILVRTKDTYR
jgi:bifunctional DNA-binding transcriptional regulator/antitoxin component of YhaV-PrlF toxin-antitoxin module